MAKTDYAQAMKDAQKKGDKKAYYTAQRQRAEKTGDTATLNKIKSKMPKPESESSKGNRAIGDFVTKTVPKALGTSEGDFNKSMNKMAKGAWDAVTSGPDQSDRAKEQRAAYTRAERAREGN